MQQVDRPDVQPQVPRWVTHPLHPWTKARLLAVERRYITTLVSHFRGRVAEWDVVNEATTSEGRLTSNIWHQVIGPEYIARALKWAHAADRAPDSCSMTAERLQAPSPQASSASPAAYTAEGHRSIASASRTTPLPASRTTPLPA